MNKAASDMTCAGCQRTIKAKAPYYGPKAYGMHYDCWKKVGQALKSMDLTHM